MSHQASCVDHGLESSMIFAPKVELTPKLTDDLLKACAQFDIFHKKLNKKGKTPASSKKPAPE